MRKKTITLTILKRLEGAQPYALPQSQLRTEVDGLVRPVVTDREMAEVIAELDAAHLIAKLDEAADIFATPDDPKWLISETGSASLARHNPARR